MFSSSVVNGKNHIVFFKRFKSFNYLTFSNANSQRIMAKKAVDLSFSNPEEAFKSKYNHELFRGYIVYMLCSSNFLVKNNSKIMKIMQKVLGKKLFELILKMTAYGHFVAGEDEKIIKPVLMRMSKFGVYPILDYSVEEDLSEEEAVKRDYEGATSETERKKPKSDDQKKREISKASSTGSISERPVAQFQAFQEFGDRRKSVASARTYFYINEDVCDRNLDIFRNCISVVASGNFGPGVAAIKLTALGRPQLLLQISEVIMKARKFVADVVGQSDKSSNILQFHLTEAMLEKRLTKHGIKDVKAFLKNVVKDREGVLHLFPWNGIIDKNFDLNETFRIPSLEDGRMVRLITQLTKQEEQMFRNMIKRVNEVFNYAREFNVPVMVDAEQTYFQPAISRITMEMMHKHNTDRLTVMNTYQCYLKGAFNEIHNDLEQARRENFYFGAKLVRGAYLEQERSRAKSIGYADPTNPSFEATTAMYQKVFDEVLRHIKISADNNEPKNKIRVMCATHNEGTVRYAIERMKLAAINPEDGTVFFGQLLGMCDYITFPLGQAGYRAYKYVPYGPVSDVMPYLSRRVEENTGILKKVKKEKSLLIKELMRRIKSGQLRYNPVL
ncbi:proline dehydrogenase 1, mitochondrial-like [Lycorma delicatula]|uniref:proline dehydrogenase 1, mitochondrial-like n=1 Tax=Lycorma delicatula TaxID=130591 RepID=UPI003F510C80